MDFQVQAAGCVVHTARAPTAFAIIHRPRYDDWSLPKGKLDAGETFEEAAVREVEEEIGIRGTLGEELPATSYTDRKGRSKIVRYWLMRADRAPSFEPNDEVDQVRWMSAAEALAALTYPRDRELLTAAVARLAAP